MEEKTRILIIEDNSDDVILLMRQLRKAQLDHQVKVVSDGKSALSFLTSEVQESDGLVAVFLDLKLPKLSGLSVLEAIREHESAKIRNLPVIVMTSSHEAENLEKFRELGVSHYVQKPITFSSFVKAVAHRFHTIAEVKASPGKF